MSRAFFAIRDDDTSFYTRPEELEAVYGPYFGSVPISLAVVPYSVPGYRERTVGATKADAIEMPLGENAVLVAWLRDRVAAGHVEVMLHGFSHLYRKIGDRWVGEFGWKPEAQLCEEAQRGKSYLEGLLNTRIRVFVPPSNYIAKAGVRAIRQAGLNLSGIMGRGGDRPWTRDYPAAYLKRWAWRLLNGDAYPFSLSLGGIRELRAYALTPRASDAQLMRALESCSQAGAPFVVATHYWEFEDHPEMRSTLAALINRAGRLDFEFSSVSRCFGAPT